MCVQSIFFHCSILVSLLFSSQLQRKGIGFLIIILFTFFLIMSTIKVLMTDKSSTFSFWNQTGVHWQRMILITLKQEGLCPIEQWPFEIICKIYLQTRMRRKKAEIESQILNKYIYIYIYFFKTGDRHTNEQNIIHTGCSFLKNIHCTVKPSILNSSQENNVSLMLSIWTDGWTFRFIKYFFWI